MVAESQCMHFLSDRSQGVSHPSGVTQPKRSQWAREWNLRGGSEVNITFMEQED